MDKNISFTLKIWRQNGPKEQGPGNAGYLERTAD